MELNFDKARKLITDLEEKLHATSSHTSAAREVLGKWIQSGEAQMRKKSAAALKQVRKKADGFTKALTKLEVNFARSLDKLTKSLEQPAKGKKSQAPRAKSKKNSKTFAMDVTKAPAAQLVEKAVSRTKPVNRGLKGQDIRVQANASGRGRRNQAKRDSK